MLPNPLNATPLLSQLTTSAVLSLLAPITLALGFQAWPPLTGIYTQNVELLPNSLEKLSEIVPFEMGTFPGEKLSWPPVSVDPAWALHFAPLPNPVMEHFGDGPPTRTRFKLKCVPVPAVATAPPPPPANWLRKPSMV